MFALDVWLRFGVYDAGGARVPGLPEWPPEPARVFCALVAGDPDESQWRALRWLEGQGVPEVHCPAANDSTTPEMFVITNETKASSPLRPGRKADKRVKPSSFPDGSRFSIVWPHAEPDEATFDALCRLARLVPYVGRSSAQAVVEARTTSADANWVGPGAQVYEPVDIGLGTADLGVPYPGYCDALESAYRDGRRAWEERRSVEYAVRTDRTPRLETDPVFGPLARLLVLTGNVSAWSVSQTAALTACLRSAVMSRVPDPLPVQLDGHVDGVAHVGFLALPNVGCPRALPAAPLGTLVRSRNEHADGRVMGLALSIPMEMEAADTFRIVDAISKPWDLKLPPTRQGDRVVTVQRQQGVSHQWATRPDRWCRPSRVWATATPVVFDQFPAGRSEELMVAQALIAAGYPPPIRVVAQRAPILPGAASHTISSVMRRARQRPKPFCHAWVEFGVDVVGPVMAGSMRYRGLGLFAPVEAMIGALDAEVSNASDLC